jgi:phosphatidylethanolamine-binding protein (PEBP) family uncharacterized protein
MAAISGIGYGGPFPPGRDKSPHYQITVFALDVDKPPDAVKDMLSRRGSAGG